MAVGLFYFFTTSYLQLIKPVFLVQVTTFEGGAIGAEVIFISPVLRSLVPPIFSKNSTVNVVGLKRIP